MVLPSSSLLEAVGGGPNDSELCWLICTAVASTFAIYAASHRALRDSVAVKAYDQLFVQMEISQQRHQGQRGPRPWSTMSAYLLFASCTSLLARLVCDVLFYDVASVYLESAFVLHFLWFLFSTPLVDIFCDFVVNRSSSSDFSLPTISVTDAHISRACLCHAIAASLALYATAFPDEYAIAFSIICFIYTFARHPLINGFILRNVRMWTLVLMLTVVLVTQMAHLAVLVKLWKPASGLGSQHIPTRLSVAARVASGVDIPGWTAPRYLHRFQTLTPLWALAFPAIIVAITRRYELSILPSFISCGLPTDETAPESHFSDSLKSAEFTNYPSQSTRRQSRSRRRQHSVPSIVVSVPQTLPSFPTPFSTTLITVQLTAQLCILVLSRIKHQYIESFVPSGLIALCRAAPASLMTFAAVAAVVLTTTAGMLFKGRAYAAWHDEWLWKRRRMSSVEDADVEDDCHEDDYDDYGVFVICLA